MNNRLSASNSGKLDWAASCGSRRVHPVRCRPAPFSPNLKESTTRQVALQGSKNGARLKVGPASNSKASRASRGGSLPKEVNLEVRHTL
jgi:hypothetical protein